MQELNINTVLIILSIGIIICLILISQFRKNIISKSSQLANTYKNDIEFKKKVEEHRKKIAIEYHNELESRKISLIEYFIEDSQIRSKRVTKGKITEHLAPYLIPNWHNPSEIVFLGSPIDMISFTNIENEKDISIDFIEIKTGNSSLNKKQRLIRNAINSERVYYRVLNLEI